MNFNSVAVCNSLSVNGPGDDRYAMTSVRERMRHLEGVRADPAPTSLRWILLRDVADVQGFYALCGKLLMAWAGIPAANV